jgi:hypothetical protein
VFIRLKNILSLTFFLFIPAKKKQISPPLGSSRVTLMPSSLDCTKINQQPVHLRLSVKSVSQPAVFLSHEKPANSIFSQPDQPKQTSRKFLKPAAMACFYRRYVRYTSGGGAPLRAYAVTNLEIELV